MTRSLDEDGPRRFHVASLVPFGEPLDKWCHETPRLHRLLLPQVQSSQARRGAQLPRSRLLRTSDGERPSQAFLGIGQGCRHVCDRACEQYITSDAVQIGSPTILSRFSNTLERFDHALQRLIVVAGYRQSLREEAERLRSPQSRAGRLIRGDPAPQFVDAVLDLTLLDARQSSNDTGQCHPH